MGSGNASDRTGLLINGSWETSPTADEVLDKFTQDPVAKVHRATPEQIEAALAGAESAARKPLAPADRQQILARTADILSARSASVIDTYVAETGFTLSDAQTELNRTVGTLRTCAEEAVRIAGEEIPVASAPGSENRLAFTIRTPIGVVAAITPFNAPLNTVSHKVGPAIAAGNAVVLKPAEQTPLCSLALAQAFTDAGLPDGFMQVLCGPGESVGQAIVSDPRVGFITFTGSTAVGLAIKQASGMAKTHFELGSNSASIVAADADLDLTAGQVLRAGFRKAGQVCTSVQRLLVERRVADQLMERLQSAVGALRAGDPRSPDTQVGPMISTAEARRAESWVSEAGDAGAQIVCGGDRHGAVLTPTLLLNPPASTTVMRDEIFAPVVAVVPVDGLDEAIDLVNAGRYGLQAGIFTQDLDTAFDAARRLVVGGVIINDTSSYHADSMPYGGVKDSGYGLEGPHYAVRDMTNPRIVVLNLRSNIYRSDWNTT